MFNVLEYQMLLMEFYLLMQRKSLVDGFFWLEINLYILSPIIKQKNKHS